MEANYLIYLVLGMVASFAGTIPVGPINISVVATTLRRNFRAGVIFSSSAAMVEILQSFLALQFGVLLSGLLFDNPYFQIGVSLVFFLIGSIFFFKKHKATVENSSKKSLPSWLSGMVISLLNPQALPFWIFVLGYYQSNRLIDIELMSLNQFSCILSFLLGVYLGKFAALSLYSYLSVYLSSRIGKLTFWMNKILGVVFILLAITQLFRLL
jgi:threonine/homoserine/homoserine lactone efflux protein